MAIYRVRSLLPLSKCKSNFSSYFLQSFSVRRLSASTTPPQSQQVGFIGLGSMGSRMANNLIKAGYEVTVHDLNRSAMKLFSERGILTKESPFEIAETSDVVITMLPSSANVLDVYTGPNGLLRSGNVLRPWLFVDSSTIDPQTSRRLSVAVSNCSLKEKKHNRETPVILDAPVSGGVLAAESGTLTFMAAKICNNLALAVSMLAVSEGFALGQSLGISATTLTKIFNSSSARCWSSDTYNPVPGVMEGVPSSRNYDDGFASKLMAKDLNLATTSAQEVGFKCPLTLQAEQIFMELCNQGHGTKDFSCVFRHFYSGKDET
ncbi:probable 3-hydroxyisobutyrate dehydrogenase, mitochondrial isoform X3 [Rhododendron vialii]|uniref:probable 3-hydroxyisobutyrate dehydrogenase, mitochondrial isoform X3 n=1 Tax=Rhododendron vialii TaxID=182163 RepID=UPI00265F314A|nr:probable 3-hydroxyisobutyrate dehydrogenase, mitochondrial isoform X3 [Rhododendron vialii]